MNIRSLIFTFPILIIILITQTCQSSTDGAKNMTQNSEITSTLIDEDELILRLSTLMSADTSRAGRDNNALLNYAIDKLYDVKLTQSGLLYEIMQKGDGDTIAWGDLLSAEYIGSYVGGSVFADNRGRNKPLEFYVGNMIDAWNEGLQLIKVGGKIRLLVPSHLGYGEEGLVIKNNKVVVPPHQLLVFEVEVLSVK